MKKLVAGAAVAALLGSAAFADVSISAWGRAVAGIGNAKNITTDGDADGTDTIISNTQSWGGNGPRNGITFEGDYEGVVGFNAQAFLNGTDGWSVGDNAQVWYQPIEQLRVAVGKVDYNPLRSSACYGLWDIYRVGTEIGDYKEPWTFMGQSATGAVVSVFPIEGLQFHASLNYPYRDGIFYAKDEDSNHDEGERKSSYANLGNVLGRNWSTYAVGYDIEGVGAIKVGVECQGLVRNKNGEYKDNQNVINAAFDFKAMEDTFYFSVGAYVPTVQKVADNNDWKENDEYIERGVGNRVNAYARITPMEGLNIHIRGGVKIGTWKASEKTEDYKKDGQLGFLFGAGVDYALMEDLTLYADVGYANGIYLSNSDKDNTDCLDFGIGVTKSYDACSVSAGFVGATNDNGMYDTTYTDGNDTKYPFSWGIPLVITYSF